MLPLFNSTDNQSVQGCLAPATCKLVRELRGDLNEPASPTAPHNKRHNGYAGVGYYLLRPGTRILPHAGPTNQRLTCHLVLQGGVGSWFKVGDERYDWQPGKAFCFDDSFVHEGAHEGDSDRYVLLVDVPHP